MDSWSDKQLQMMFLGGNQQCKDYLMSHRRSPTTTTIRNRNGDDDEGHAGVDQPIIEEPDGMCRHMVFLRPSLFRLWSFCA